MSVTSLTSRARYHQWANVQLTDFLLETDRTGVFCGHDDTRSRVRDLLCRTMTIDCRWLDRLEGGTPCDAGSRFAHMDLASLLKARSLLDARLMAAVNRLGPAAPDETVMASNGIKISLPSVVRFMLARNQRQRSSIAEVLAELDLMPPLMGERLFEARTRRQLNQPAVSTSIDSPILAAAG